ncbi:hypothetical protein C1X05_15690 [Laceyella sacchari]|uniref:Phage tail tube protein n=1 Tax=Laceyella tengchongensis TaxID=574699 RepID=A0AA45WQR2_9BACL|nr:phage tail tube protein [Laceyella tengchongensis]AUS10127.1 hypothetical protein C1X05_15690 [Laceyella sacchari]SMP27328.1 Phage tail tube protein [Laceyella tengchongensis]
MATNGSTVLLMVKEGTNWIAVGEQTGLSIEELVNLIEAGHKGLTTQQYVYGKKEGSISLEGLYVKDDAGYLALKNAFKNRTAIMVRRQENGVNVEDVECLIESMSTEFPDDDVSTISVELKMNGEWTPAV